LDSGVAAMDAHRGVADVVVVGLWFLARLAFSAGNQVGGEGFVVAVLGGCQALVAVREEHTGLGWAVWAGCVCALVQRGGGRLAVVNGNM
jgi:hypothetical protein